MDRHRSPQGSETPVPPTRRSARTAWNADLRSAQPAGGGRRDAECRGIIATSGMAHRGPQGRATAYRCRHSRDAGQGTPTSGRHSLPEAGGGTVPTSGMAHRGPQGRATAYRCRHSRDAGQGTPTSGRHSPPEAGGGTAPTSGMAHRGPQGRATAYRCRHSRDAGQGTPTSGRHSLPEAGGGKDPEFRGGGGNPRVWRNVGTFEFSPAPLARGQRDPQTCPLRAVPAGAAHGRCQERAAETGVSSTFRRRSSLETRQIRASR